MAKKKTRVLLPGGIQGLVHDLQNGGNMNAPKVLKDDENDTESRQNADNTHHPADNSQPVVSQPDNSPTPSPAPSAANGAAVATQQADNEQDVRGTSAAVSPSPTPSENRVQSYNPANGSEYASHTEGNNAQNSASVSQNGAAGAHTDTNRPLGDAANSGRSYSPGRPAKQNTMKEYHIVKDDSKDSWDLFLDMAKQYKDGGGKLATIYIDGTLKNVLDRMKYVGEEKLPTSAMLSSIVARFIYDHEDEIRKALFSGELI